jgi:steroid 5-alpha reductase family enzyme
MMMPRIHAASEQAIPSSRVSCRRLSAIAVATLPLLLSATTPLLVGANFDSRQSSLQRTRRRHHRRRHRQRSFLPRRIVSEQPFGSLYGSGFHNRGSAGGDQFVDDVPLVMWLDHQHSYDPNDGRDVDDDGSPQHSLRRYALVAASLSGGALVAAADPDATTSTPAAALVNNDTDFPGTFITEEITMNPSAPPTTSLPITNLGSSTTVTTAQHQQQIMERLTSLSAQRLIRLARTGSALLVPFVCALFGVRRESSASTSPLMSFGSIYIWSLIGSSVGFYVFLYFISVGYALGIGLPILVTTIAHVRYRTTTTGLRSITEALPLVQAGLVLLWSLRLTVFLLWREHCNWPALHAKIVRVNRHQQSTLRLWQKLTCWTVYSFLYVCLLSPCWARLEQQPSHHQGLLSGSSTIEWVLLIGIALQIVGLSLETIADWQKSAFKKRHHRQSWCRIGVWQHLPHPNYLGEWLFWCGTYLGGSSPCSNLDRSMRLVGLGFISIVLHGAASTLQSKQSIKYGAPYDAFRASHTVFGPKLLWHNKRTTSGSSSIVDVDAETMPSLDVRDTTTTTKSGEVLTP